MAPPFHTVGHSTRAIAEFVELLQLGKIELVVDVRTVPRSRTNPQYNGDALPGSLAAFGIGYEHMAPLGGLRPRSPGVPPETNAFWENDSFHNYADYALGDPFHAGLTQLRKIGHDRRIAVMCAEAVWWRCHRRIIADYLLSQGETVFHLLGSDRIEPARMTEAARLRPDGKLVYPKPPPAPPVQKDLFG